MDKNTEEKTEQEEPLTLHSMKEEGDKLIVTHIEDIEPILKQNYEDRKNSDENWQASQNWKHAARIPISVFLELQKLGIADDPVALKKWLESFGKQYKTTNKTL